MSNNLEYLVIALALLFAILAIAKPSWPCLPVSVILIAIELFSKVSKSVIIAALLGLSVTAMAQGIGDSVGNIAANMYSNGVAAVFYGQKMTDAKVHSWGAIYGYNATQNANGANAYVVAGVDRLWDTGNRAPSDNYTLSGGVTLGTKDYYPADWIGVTNSWFNKVTVKTAGTILIGSPTSGGASLMNVERIAGYVSIHDWNIGKFEIEPDLGIAYGNRTGVNSTYDGNWWNAFFAISIHGRKP